MIVGTSQPKPGKEAVLTKAFLKAAELLGMTRRDIGRLIGVSEATVSRLVSGRHLGLESKHGELARLFLRLFRSLDTLLGGNTEDCRRWFVAFNRHLNGVPAELVLTTSGLVHVVDYLDAMRGKL